MTLSFGCATLSFGCAASKSNCMRSRSGSPIRAAFQRDGTALLHTGGADEPDAGDAGAAGRAARLAAGGPPMKWLLAICAIVLSLPAGRSGEHPVRYPVIVAVLCFGFRL